MCVRATFTHIKSKQQHSPTVQLTLTRTSRRRGKRQSIGDVDVTGEICFVAYEKPHIILNICTICILKL